MICILSTSGLEKAISACGAETSKAMLLIGEKPICSTILNELQRLEEHFEKIVLAGSGLKEFEDWARFGMHDEFFKTKFIFLKDDNAESIDDDVWGAFDWLSERHGLNPEVLIMRPDMYALDISKFTDGSLGSFRAYADGKPLNVWKLDDFVEAVNLMVSMEAEDRWSMENLQEELMQRGKMEALDVSNAFLKLETRKDYIEAWKRQAEADSFLPFAVEIDCQKQTVKTSNAWRSRKWTASVWKTERMVQSELWDRWDFLECATPCQKPYLQTPVDRGPNVRGEYCNWIELQLIPDSSIQAMMMQRKMDERSWREIVEKALDALEEHFWTEKDPDWRSDADRKDRTKFLERLSDRWTDLVAAKVPTFSMIKWDTLLKRHLEWMESHVKDRKSVFHNGTGGRLVHGNLTLGSILCNWQTLDMHFINPTNRTGILVDSFSEYAGLYADCWCLLPVFIHGRHVDYGANGLDVPDYIADNAYAIESILDARLGEKAVQAKIEALMAALEMMDVVPEEHRKAFMAFLQYRANELYVGSIHSRTAVDQQCIGADTHYSRCPKSEPLVDCIKEDRECRKIRNRMCWQSGWKMHLDRP